MLTWIEALSLYGSRWAQHKKNYQDEDKKSTINKELILRWLHDLNFFHHNKDTVIINV